MGQGVDNWAVCRECGNRYDTRAGGFCPRCGSRMTAAKGADGGPVGVDPGYAVARRRARLGGILLIVLGALVALLAALSLLSLAAPPDELGNALAANSPPAGGHLHLTILDGGQATNATLVFADAAGVPFLNATTDASGHADVDLGNHSTFRLDARDATHNTTRHGLVYAFQNVTATIDLADAPPHPWIGLDEIVAAGRIGVLVIGGMALLMVLSGVLAVLGRAFPISIAAGLPMPLAILLFAYYLQSPGLAVLGLLMAAALLMVGMSRAGFRRIR